MIRSGALAVAAPFLLIWFALLRIKRGWSWPRLFFLSLFMAYVVVVLAVTLFPIPVERIFQPQFAEVPFSSWIELRPFTISFQATIIKNQTLPNVALGIPFGFGAWFVLTRPSWRKVILFGIAAAAAIELLQLAIGLALVGYPYRVTDISDFIFNVAGVAVGIALFYGFSWAWRSLDGGTSRSGLIGHVRCVVSRQHGSDSAPHLRNL